MAAKVPPAKVARTIEIARHYLARLHRRMVPPPVAMMEMVAEMWAAQAITAAAQLGIADALANGPLSAEDLAAAVDADAGALRRLLRALISRGIFRQRRDGRYDLTPLADTLRRDAEISVDGWARWLGSPQHREHWTHLTDAIRTGRPVIQELRGKPAFEYLASEAELGEIFNSAMTGGSAVSIPPVIAAYDFSPYATIVDVGGGHGRLLAAILAATPGARGILFDLPQVVAGAPAMFAEHGVQNRVRVDEGSFFESVPAGGDAYVLKSVIHDWPDDDAVRILRNVRSAAATGSHVLLIEFVVPKHHREYLGNWLDLEMLVALDAQERTAAQFDQLFRRAGFQLTRVVQTASPFHILEARAI
ncbi:methyltransferase [Mycobacterium angelicum]|uniref:Hydroxyneurosporene methyltransferase n=1 Tax=Mycobacterium angelicum TaxID=470074 RepID=A0A1W9ZM80_MYCAN|nr:methyltransferase [Mycobacterium angelicum]MCV7196231.1 hydroxyneurosporene methyltransferase [Mycobacterium angelicum]ORA18967.1 hydroxyneurosporene methyltransferase [Mycobacterium angelicum]